MDTCHLRSFLLSLLIIPMISAGQTGAGDSLPPPGSEPGSAYVEQFLAQDQWHGYCLPVKNSVTYPFISLNLDMRWYDEPSHHWVEITDTTGDSVLVDPMRGYRLYSSSFLSGNSVVGIKGQLNTGDITYTVTSTGTGNGQDGWNLTGNPYPSAVSWYLVGLDQVDPTLFVYSPIWHNYIFWNRVNGIHTSICRSVIPAMQGFFVHCNAFGGGTGQVIMTNTARLHDPGQIYQDNPDYDSLLVLSVTAGGYRDETVIWLNDTASLLFESHEDALKLFGDPDAPQLFSEIQQDRPLALNARPFEGPGTRVNLGFSTSFAGTDTLIASNLESFPDTMEIWLEDYKENRFQKLNTDPEYIFSSLPVDDTTRFAIFFSNPYMSVFGKTPSGIRIWASGEKLFIDLSKTSGNESGTPVELFDLTGRTVFLSQLYTRGLNVLSPDLPPGYYVVRVIGDLETCVRKVLLQ